MQKSVATYRGDKEEALEGFQNSPQSARTVGHHVSQGLAGVCFGVGLAASRKACRAVNLGEAAGRR